MSTSPVYSVVLPCRNEEKAIGVCLDRISKTIAQHQLDAEIVVSDSSTDSSREIIARYPEVRVIKHNKDGYGNACREGVVASRGQYILLVDADGTYELEAIPLFFEKLKQGADFVIGDRFAKKMESGAMPFLNKYVGNPVLSFLVRIFFKSKVRDTHCGMRACTREAFSLMCLRTTGMEFASEMVIKAARYNFSIAQVPISYHRRLGESKLKPFTDGWRHLRFILLYSPLFLFFLPGAIMFGVGVVASAVVYARLPLLGWQFYYHPLFLLLLLVIGGYQLMIFAFFAKTYAVTHLGETSKLLDWLHRHITIERAVLVGGLAVIVGVLLYGAIFVRWAQAGFGELEEIRLSFVAMTLGVIGVQTIFSSFMLSILGIKHQ